MVLCPAGGACVPVAGLAHAVDVVPLHSGRRSGPGRVLRVDAHVLRLRPLLDDHRGAVGQRPVDAADHCDGLCHAPGQGHPGHLHIRLPAPTRWRRWAEWWMPCPSCPWPSPWSRTWSRSSLSVRFVHHFGMASAPGSACSRAYGHDARTVIESVHLIRTTGHRAYAANLHDTRHPSTDHRVRGGGRWSRRSARRTSSRSRGAAKRPSR